MKSGLWLRPAEECHYDAMSLGEVILRLDSGEDRIRTARAFRASGDRGKCNVTRGSHRAFGRRAVVATTLTHDEVGLPIGDCILQGGMDTPWIKWVDSSGVGRNMRNDLSFTGRRSGVHGTIGCSDRGNMVISQLEPRDVNWGRLSDEVGVCWLRTGGIFTALGPESVSVTRAAIQATKKHGTVVSYDLNCRPSLWESAGDKAKCQEVNRDLAQYMDVAIRDEGDSTTSPSFEIERTNESLNNLEVGSFKGTIETTSAAYPSFQCIGTTMRQVCTAAVNGQGAAVQGRRQGFVQTTQRGGSGVLSHAGSGGSFIPGLVYGLMELGDITRAVSYEAAHKALVVTAPGGTSMASPTEVKNLVAEGSAHVRRQKRAEMEALRLNKGKLSPADSGARGVV